MVDHVARSRNDSDAAYQRPTAVTEVVTQADHLGETPSMYDELNASEQDKGRAELGASNRRNLHQTGFRE